MSIENVTSRIAQIQAQMALLAPARTTSTIDASATEFASTLARALPGQAGGAPVGTAGPVDGTAVVAEAKKYLGLPYVWGGTDPTKGLDCSGLVQLVYKNLGYDLPRVSADQARQGREVSSLAEAQPGDLLAWDNSSRNNGADHIAIYIGGGQMIEAPRTGLDIRIIDVPSEPTTIRRILPDSGAAPAAVAGREVPSSTPYADLFRSAAAATGVSAPLLAAVAKHESGFDPSAVSPAGGQGLMQLMPATADGLGVRDPFDPRQAVDGAARLLSDLLDRFGRTDLALAAYHAGPGAVLRYDDVPPYPETQSYVRSILSTLTPAGGGATR